MRVLMFIPALNAGGAERVMVTLSNYLVTRGHSVCIQTINSNDSFYSVEPDVLIKGMTVKFGRSKMLRRFQIPFVEIKRRREFIRSVQEYGPDVVLSFLYTTNVLALLSKKQIGVPLVISERNDPTIGNILHHKVCATLYPKAHLIVCQSNSVADYFTKISGKCQDIANPLNANAIGGYAKKRGKTIVSVGRLIPQKNHKILIDAFSKVYSKHPDYTLEIIGEGPLKDKLELQIKERQLDNVVHIRGNIKNVMTQVCNSACFALSSDFEGFPNVLLEAMASGMPVVSTDFGTGIARDLIIDGVNGFVVPVGDADQLAIALDKVISSEEYQEKMGQSNLYVKEKYSEAAICSQWEDALNRVIGQNNA